MPRAHKTPIVLDERQQARFWSKVNKVAAKGCWLWTGQTDGFGYGMMKSHQKPLRTHRIAWTLLRGAIPDDKALDHRCRVPSCVNPDHLEVVTNKENTLRGVSFSAINAVKTHCSRGHELTTENTRRRKNRPSRRECKICERQMANQRYARKTAADSGASPSLPKAKNTKMFCDCGKSEYWCIKGCEMPEEQM